MEQNLNLYQIFYEVANCRNFSIAAKKLYISQPAISKSIAKLEEHLHTALFHRSSRGVTLTTEGETLYKHVESAILSLRSGEDLLKSATSQGISHLSIGVSTTLCKYVLLPLLKDFIATNPNIKITISCQSTFETIADLKSGAIDIGLVGIPSGDISEASFISYLPIKTIEDIFVATDTYLAPFLHKNKADSYEFEAFFKEASFIMLDKENISRKHTDTFLNEHQFTLHNIIEVNNMDLSIEFARAGLGIACVINDFVKEDLKNGTLRELKLGHKVSKRQIGFAYPSKIPMTTSMNTLIQYYQMLM
ncbi:LysR family transcriptional regulator [Kineothrix sp. MB12-C1]|uniref:LysR family transcriptional regulator n=1 Tax=Kineothrix sp. MB12-C1 TaxID=3070215 RepID=UPI0027D2609C|nr:LysR family transcriptional regulator [Kineothrix sp. MB12-C1]WMC92859.1 LysR family transcriptional regulator [Kineothrix sp. MB12-C1]